MDLHKFVGSTLFWMGFLFYWYLICPLRSIIYPCTPVDLRVLINERGLSSDFIYKREQVSYLLFHPWPTKPCLSIKQWASDLSFSFLFLSAMVIVTIRAHKNYANFLDKSFWPASWDSETCNQMIDVPPFSFPSLGYFDCYSLFWPYDSLSCFQFHLPKA